MSKLFLVRISLCNFNCNCRNIDSKKKCARYLAVACCRLFPVG